MIITKDNYINLKREILNLIRLKKQQVELKVTDRKELLPNFKNLAPYLEEVANYENYIQIKIVDIPYCFLPDIDDRMIFNDLKKGKTKIKQCQGCRYERRCGGILDKYLLVYGDEEIKTVKDLPREVMIEVEPRCNFNCVFCFNKNSFAKQGRDVKTFSTSQVKKIIDAIAKAEVGIIRFTGGEPLLRKDIFDLMEYAKLKGLKVRLNTNGSLINNKEIVKKLNKLISSILIPIESYSDEKESLITRHHHSLEKKIKAIKLLKKEGMMTIRAGTVGTKESIKNLEKIFKLVQRLKLDDWEIYRPIPIPENKFPILRSDVKILVNKLIKFSQIAGRTFNIVNGIPFCAYDKKKINSISRGALPVDGHIRYAIDPRGYAKPDYYIDKNIGDPLDIKGCWNHPFMKRMRNLKYVPRECKNCEFVEKCRGGSRFAAKVAYHSFKAKDPLAGYDRI
jgi:radical SAM protein with 4Fe4S-binding SPASM domain